MGRREKRKRALGNFAKKCRTIEDILKQKKTAQRDVKSSEATVTKETMVIFFSITYYKSSRRRGSTKTSNAEYIGPGEYALLAVPVVTFCLGTWQVKRRAWKLNLIEEVTKKSLEPPIQLPDNLEDLSKMEYQKVRVRGHFDHSEELYIGPRTLLTPEEEVGSLVSSQSKNGNLVITPFHLTDRNITILVNRGWVPRIKTDPATRSEAQITGEIELVGAVRLSESRPQFSPNTEVVFGCVNVDFSQSDSESNSRLFFYRDVPKMVAMTGAEPIFLDADASSTVPGGPIGGQTKITFKNHHLSNLLAWYSVSALTSFMWYIEFIKGV